MPLLSHRSSPPLRLLPPAVKSAKNPELIDKICSFRHFNRQNLYIERDFSLFFSQNLYPRSNIPSSRRKHNQNEFCHRDQSPNRKLCHKMTLFSTRIYNSKEWGLSKKSYMLIVVIPNSSLVTGLSSPMMMIFLNESSIFNNEARS